MNNILTRILALSFISCFTAPALCQPINQWAEFGLNGKSVYVLRQNGASLFAVTSDGIYKKDLSQNQDWVPLGFENQIIVNLFVDTAGPGSLHVAVKPETGPNPRPTSFFISTDGGSTWLPSGSVVLDFVYGISGECNNGCVFYAGGTGDKPILRSEDNGTSWTAVSTGIEKPATTIAITINPNNASVVYASVVQEVPPQGILRNSLFKSLDEGTNWESVFEHYYGEDGPIIESIAGSPSDANVLFAGVGGNLYKSIDGGETHKLIHVMDRQPLEIDASINEIILDRTTESHMLAGGSVWGFTLSESWDGGETWKKIQGPAGIQPVRSMIQDANDPRVFYIGTGSGLSNIESRVYKYVTSPNANSVHEWSICN